MNITSFLIYCVIVTFTPGPTNIAILSIVQSFGTKSAMKYTFGATIAFGLLLTISALLNTMLMAVIPKILFAMQIIGCTYMLYLAFQIYKMNVTEPSDIRTSTFLSGFVMQFVNPKVILFTMTVIPSFVMPYYTDTHALAIFAAAITIIGFCAFITWVVFGIVLKKYLQKYQKRINIIMALFLVYSAIMVSGAVELLKR